MTRTAFERLGPGDIIECVVDKRRYLITDIKSKDFKEPQMYVWPINLNDLRFGYWRFRQPHFRPSCFRLIKDWRK